MAATADKRSITSPLNGLTGGVKTDEGKCISSKNSLKHGLFSKIDTTLDDGLSFNEIHEGYLQEFASNSQSQKLLIIELTTLHMRLVRSLKFEADYIKSQLNPPVYERKLIKKAIDVDFTAFQDQYETTLVQEGEKMAFSPQQLAGLENIYTKYEPSFLNRYLQIIEFLTRGNK